MKTLKKKPINQLYHQFLKPAGIPQDLTWNLATKLCESSFIDIFGNNEEGLRYTENEKLTNQQNKNELFKIIEGLK